MYQKEPVYLGRFRPLLLITAVFVLSDARSEAQPFTPPVDTFTGYIHEVYSGKGVWFNYFSRKKRGTPHFRYDKSTKSIYFNDSNMVLVFWGMRHPLADCGIDFSVLYPDSRFSFKDLPKINSRKHKFKNEGDSTVYKHIFTRKKVRFTAYDYEYYKQYDIGSCGLNSFEVYAKPLSPRQIKTSNKFFIINYFIRGKRTAP